MKKRRYRGIEMLHKNVLGVRLYRISILLFPFFLFCLMNSDARAQSSAPLIQSGGLSLAGTFELPKSLAGSTYGFNYAGTGGNGAYAVSYNPSNNSLFIGGHPYDQKIAEIIIPQSFVGSPTAAAAQSFADPLEGKMMSINPTDPNSKVLGSSFVFNGRLYLGAFSYYDGAGTQKKSHFVRPLNLSTKGQVAGPFTIGDKYPGWVDKFATVIPQEWRSLFQGSVMVGGAGGCIDSLQSSGPSLSVINPENIGALDPAPAKLVVGYPYGHSLNSGSAGNPYWSASDIITGSVFISGTRSVLFFGKHGSGSYCYGPGTADLSLAGQPADGGVDTYCYDPVNGSKGVHNYPYQSQVWAYDANDLMSVKNGKKDPWAIRPYAVWQLNTSFKDVQGVGYDPSTQRIYVSAACNIADCMPTIFVYKIDASANPSTTVNSPYNLRFK